MGQQILLFQHGHLLPVVPAEHIGARQRRAAAGFRKIVAHENAVCLLIVPEKALHDAKQPAGEPRQLIHVKGRLRKPVKAKIPFRHAMDGAEDVIGFQQTLQRPLIADFSLAPGAYAPAARRQMG